MPILQQACIILLLMFSANTAMSAAAFKFGQLISSPRAGDSFELPTLTAIDASGNPDPSYTGTHTLLYWNSKNGPIVGTPSYTTQVYFQNGENKTPLKTTLVCAEATTLMVSDTNIVGSLTLTVFPASPHAFMLTTEHQGVVNAGCTFTVTVTAIDIYGNTADTYEGNKPLNWMCTATKAPYGTATPIIPSNGTVTFTNGIANIPGFVLFNASETPLISISDGLMAGSSWITVKPGKNDCFNVATQHDNVETAGQGFGLTLSIIDPYGNLTGTPSGTLDITCDWDAANSPDGTEPSPLPGSRSITFTEGTASFGTFTLVDTRQMPRITVRSGSLISGTSSPIRVNPSDPAKLQLSSSGTVIIAGDAFLLGTITAQDSFGNTATGYSGSKSITYSEPHTGPKAGTPSYTHNVRFDYGISTTPLLTTLVCAETTSVTIQADNMTGSSNVLTVLPGSANCFDLLTQHNGTETAGVPFSVNIIARDIFGNLASRHSGGGHTLNWTWDATGSIMPTKPANGEQTFTNGQAVVSGFILTNTQQTPRISVEEGNIRGTTSQITVKAAEVVHHLQIITEHQTAGIPFSVKLIACDELGNPTGYVGTEWINLTWDATPSSWGISPTLPPSGSYTFKAGSVTIAGCKITNALDTPVIRAQFGTITGTSSPIAVSPGQAASFRIIAPTLVTMDVSFTLTGITAYDSCGNTATTYIGSKPLSYSSPGGNPSYTSPVYFDRGISQTVLQTTLTKAETVSLRITDGTISGTSNPITVKPGSITSLEVTTEHQLTETAGTPFAVILTLKDKSGNTVTDYNGSLPVDWSWTAGNSPNNGTPTKPGDGNQSFSNGVARINGFILTNAAESPSITARTGSLTGTSRGITVKPGAASSFRVIADTDRVTAGASFTLTSITALDAFGNIASGYQGTKSLTYSGPGSGPISGEPTYPPQTVNFASGVSAQRLELRLVRAAEETTIKVEQGSISGYSQKIVIEPAKAARFDLSTENKGTATAGASFTLTIIAKDSFGNNASSYSDLHPLIWGWDAKTSPRGIPGFRPSDGNQAFSSGVAVIAGVVLTNAAQTSIWVQEGDNIFGAISINVMPAAAAYFDISLPSPVTVNQPFRIGDIKAKDRLGNIAANYSGTVSLNFSGLGTDSLGNKPEYPTAVIFEAGIATSTLTMPMTITPRKPETVSISLWDNNVRGTSSQITVVALSATCLVWPHEVYANATQTINYMVTNTGDEAIKEIRINIPDGFTYIDAGSPEVSTKQQWSASGSSSGQYVVLTPNSVSSYLPRNAILHVPIYASTVGEERLPAKWTSIVTGEHGAIVPSQEMIDGDSEVSITAYILDCWASTNEVLPGGVATITAKVIYQPTGQGVANTPVEFGSMTAYTNANGIAYVNLPSGTSTGTITVEAKYRLFNAKTVSLRVVSPTPLITSGKNSLVKEGIIYANPATPFDLTPYGSFTCQYKLDTGEWQKFLGSFTISSIGEHTISYRYVDSSGHPGDEHAAIIHISPIQTTKLTNFPNPFNPLKEETFIQYYLKQPTEVNIRIYNLFGELVWMKDIPAGQSGTQQIPWNGRNGDNEIVGNGSYICRVIIKYPGADTVIMSRKIGVVK